LLDGFEVTYNFDPLVIGEADLDPDIDGLSNLQEQGRRSNPLLADTDSDGVNDADDFAPNDPLVQVGIDVLLVDDSQNLTSLIKYQEALTSLGLTSTVWNKSLDGLPQRELLAEHTLTLWFTGEAQFLNSAEEVTLSNYLNGGGCLLLSSQDYHFVRRFVPFMNDYLGLSAIEDDQMSSLTLPESNIVQLTADGSLFDSPVLYDLEFDFSNFGDRIELDQAEGLFFGDDLNANVYGSYWNQGVFQSSYLGFPLETVSSIPLRADLISKISDACYYTHDLSVPGETVPPDEDRGVPGDGGPDFPGGPIPAI